ncbi:hypothetical protein PHYSODRAFT_331106 [Phytophthora sojae]|uniref:DUF6604 domain-containing protein n=1 Tax=Phytophthora sojae (strain P6497) TaxID=1094619 RepID=G4ZGK9_PHYSP|nr:hypothetical protein PHYSODRAFT_331106 [Phytophthora sojae]EGZ17091.1 hypothetical protein PHYSODRAFT_331106 [Phytophthora sojae]|eukprot:XP_009526149.1 hypothetical protein PHYSODRAFT_331106 [Phytophthora sojae]
MSSFPASKYSRYKRATAFFLDWLLRARDHGRHTGKRVQLRHREGHCGGSVESHAQTTVGASQGPRCVSMHFLELLRSWLDTLKGMEVDEDYFPDEDTGFGASGVPKRAKADRKRLFEEAFAEDLKLELVSYFLELEELVEGVFDVYDQVKKQQHTLVEATVAKVAMNTVSSMTAQLQLKYPALKTAEDVFTLLREQILERVQKRVSNAVTAARQKFEEGTPFTHVPGMLLIDFENVLCTLKTFAGLFPESTKGGRLFLQGSLGESYGEDRTPEYVLPDPSSRLVILIAQQLPMLYNAYVDRVNHTGSGFDQFGLVSSFMKLTSVVALQGNADLDDRRRFYDQIFTSFSGIQSRSAGCALKPFFELDNDFQFLRIAHDLVVSTTAFRAFGHVYNALVNEGYLEHIPFFDDVLRIYEHMIFTPSQATAEVVETRVLSRDMVTLNGDLADVLCEMFDVLSEGYLDLLPEAVPGESRNDRLDRALENLRPVLALLDSLQQNGSTMDPSMIPAEARNENMGSERLHEGCRQISAIVKAKFASSSGFCEDKYLTYPTQADFVRHEYGSASSKGYTEAENHEEVFHELMNLLQTSNGPLHERKLEHLKDEIKKDPDLLAMVSLRKESDEIDVNAVGYPDDDLCALFHQAAASPSHDLHLVEWMIQMGALGHDDIVCTIVGADNMLDLDTPTFYVGETLAHLAVKHGHRDVYDLVVSENCDTKFTVFVVHTAQLLVSMDRKPQAREILDVLEKRLLKTPFDKRDPSAFRAVVQMSSAARDSVGMGPLSFCEDLTDWFTQLTTTVDTTNEQFDELKSAVKGISELSGVVCLRGEGKRVVYGGATKVEVKQVRESMVEAAKGVGVQFDDESSKASTSSVRVGEFEISVRGAFRNAVAA